MIGKGKWVICGHCNYSMKPRHIFKGPPKLPLENFQIPFQNIMQKRREHGEKSIQRRN